MKVLKDIGILSYYVKIKAAGALGYILPFVKDIAPYREDIQSALDIAAENNDILCGCWLIDYGANVNYGIDGRGKEMEGCLLNPPIFRAVKCGASEFLTLLLSKGANPNVFSHDDETPLTAAIRHLRDTQREEMIKRLLTSGAEPELARKGDAKHPSFIEYIQSENMPYIRIPTFSKVINDSCAVFGFYDLCGLRWKEKTVMPPFFSADYELLSPVDSTLIFREYHSHRRIYICLSTNQCVSKSPEDDVKNQMNGEAWIYDETLAHFIVDRPSNGTNTVVVFRNGFYYLYDSSENRYSDGFESISDPNNQNIRTYSLFGKYGLLKPDGKCLTYPIFDEFISLEPNAPPRSIMRGHIREEVKPKPECSDTFFDLRVKIKGNKTVLWHKQLRSLRFSTSCNINLHRISMFVQRSFIGILQLIIGKRAWYYYFRHSYMKQMKFEEKRERISSKIASNGLTTGNRKKIHIRKLLPSATNRGVDPETIDYDSGSVLQDKAQDTF